MLVHVTVRVDAIDGARHIVTFTGPNGVIHTVLLHRQAMQDFARKLKPNDNAHIYYLQVMSINMP